MEGMYCKNCGKEISDNSNFCQYCGIQLIPFAKTGKVNNKVDSTLSVDDTIVKYCKAFFIQFKGCLLRIILFLCWFGLIAFLSDGISLAEYFAYDVGLGWETVGVIIYTLLIIPGFYVLWYTGISIYRCFHKKK